MKKDRPVQKPLKENKAAVPAEKVAPKAPPMAPKKYINVYLSVGSNVGDRLENVRAASTAVHKAIGKIARKSKLYETQAWGKTDQEPYLNQVIMINTILDPRKLLEEIDRIEKELGRERKEKWGPRTIDIDILFYGRRVVRDKGLEVPHPELHNRMFVLAPLLEIAPELEHPMLHKTVEELFMVCRDLSEVVMLDIS
jgi:2-amino-4-hydroxy-6-hydroxymethyldihydropteridine diphosphokinase